MVATFRIFIRPMFYHEMQPWGRAQFTMRGEIGYTLRSHGVSQHLPVSFIARLHLTCFAKIIYYAFYLKMILWRKQRSGIKKMSARTTKLGIFMSLIHLRWQYGWRFPTVAANVLIKTHKKKATYGAAPKQLSYCQKEINQIQHITILYCIQLSYTKSWNRRSNWHGSVQSLNHKLIKSVGCTQHTKSLNH